MKFDVLTLYACKNRMWGFQIGTFNCRTHRSLFSVLVWPADGIVQVDLFWIHALFYSPL